MANSVPIRMSVLRKNAENPNRLRYRMLQNEAGAIPEFNSALATLSP